MSSFPLRTADIAMPWQRDLDKRTTAVYLKEFLETVPPGAMKVVDFINDSKDADVAQFDLPELDLHCTKCEGVRHFRPSGNTRIEQRLYRRYFLQYKCGNCEMSVKTYALSFSFEPAKARDQVTVRKINGEEPPFGQPTSNEMFALVEGHKDTYLRGRRCENQGLGVGAFAYYRQLVEGQKDEIFDKLIEAAKTLNGDAHLVEELEKAKGERRFADSVESIKTAIPDALLIRGQNPLVLLHKALSDGLHNQSDEQCLQIAASIRVILSHLATKMKEVVLEDAEVVQALEILKNKPH